MTRFPPEFLNQAHGDLAPILLRAAMIADRRQRAIEHALHALDSSFVPRAADDFALELRAAVEHRSRCDAAEREAGRTHASGRIAIQRHRRRHRADVVESPFGNLVEAYVMR